ncbi:MAG: hypothetical protein WAX04_14110, partial [Oscillospiraceae bacterium]
VQVATTSARIFLPLDELIDKDKELERLNREKATCQKDIDMLAGKIANESFVAKAPAKVVDEIKVKLAKANELMQKINDSLNTL